MPIKKSIAIALVLMATLFANAHEFWLQPKKYRYHIGEEIKIDFMVGENFTGELWDLNRHKAEKANLYRASGVKDLTNEVRSTKGNNLSIQADQDGTYIIALQSNAAYIELAASAFNDYLKEDGLDNILEERKKLKQLDKPSKELYSRYAKLLVQVGEGKDDTFKKALGMRYEIIPDKNPYSLRSGDYLGCKVFFEGNPAPHTLVKVWSKLKNTTFVQDIYTENDGSIRFPISTTGEWMVSSIKMISSEKAGADYHSLWASLVFEI